MAPLPLTQWRTRQLVPVQPGPICFHEIDYKYDYETILRKKNYMVFVLKMHGNRSDIPHCFDFFSYWILCWFYVV